MVTANQNSIINIHTIKKKEYKHTLKIVISEENRTKEERKKELQNKSILHIKNKQQRPIVEHRELYSIPCNNL